MTATGWTCPPLVAGSEQDRHRRDAGSARALSFTPVSATSCASGGRRPRIRPTRRGCGRPCSDEDVEAYRIHATARGRLLGGEQQCAAVTLAALLRCDLDRIDPRSREAVAARETYPDMTIGSPLGVSATSSSMPGYRLLGQELLGLLGRRASLPRPRSSCLPARDRPRIRGRAARR